MAGYDGNRNCRLGRLQSEMRTEYKKSEMQRND